MDFVPDKHQFLRGDVKVDTLEDVKSCHRALCSMIARIPRDLVPPDPANIWVTYGQGAVSRGLQKALCVLIDERIAADYGTARAHRGDKQRMTSCSAKNAGAWLTAIPSSPAATLMDTEFRYAARHRLGLPPQHNLPAACPCGAALRDDPAHFHSCSRLMPRAITARHDGIVQLVAAIFRRAGALVNIEVKCDGETRVRPDIEIILPDHSILVDVAVVHPSAPSRRSLTPLAATRDIENIKAAKYSSVASERARFMAFIVESYGSWKASHGTIEIT